jgi:hypothetical protein
VSSVLRGGERCADDEDGEGGGFFYDEEEVLAGAGGDERAAILDRFDAMLQIPSSDGVEDVRCPRLSASPFFNPIGETRGCCGVLDSG